MTLKNKFNLNNLWTISEIVSYNDLEKQIQVQSG
jgi:phage pi2 protein 07